MTGVKSLRSLVTGGLLIAAVMSYDANVAGAAPTRLIVSEGFTNPIGFYDATPTFSWQLPKGATAQTAYQVVVDGQWDSGKVASSQSVFVPYAGKPLQSRQQVTWKVKYWDENGRESGWSETARFELGLLKNADWKAKWIRMGALKPPQATAGRKTPTITVRKAVYGVPGKPAQQRDITGRIREKVESGVFAFEVSNDLAGGDPAYRVVKSLELEYAIDGKAVKKTIAENTMFSFFPGAAKGATSKTFVPEYLRREFSAKADVEKARLYVTAKGLYEVYLNGEKVGEDYMAPGWTPYHKRIETLTYDITDRIKKGANAIGAILGEGWYAGDMMRKKFVYPQAKPVLLVQIEITYRDGTTETIVTDQAWKATNRGAIRYSSIYHGETYDANLEMPGWNTTAFDDASWAGVIEEAVAPQPPLVPKRHYPTRATEELKTVKVTQPEPGRFVFDLGQNMVGWPRLAIPVEEGNTITVRVAEMLQKNGTLYTANYRSAKSTDYYTAAKTGTITWQPTFTFHGNRYVELSGLPEGAKPEPGWVTGVVLHSDFPSTGSFASSHKLLNQLQQNIRWGQRGNYLDIPTDCPQRNERLGWTGDAQVFCSTSIFNYDTHSFWMSWLQSVRQEQTAKGHVHHVIPDTGCGAGSPGWGDVAVTSPWNVYVRTGDIRVLEKNYVMMEKWVGAYENEAKDFIVARKGFGDWLQPYPKSKGNKADTPMEVIATAYFGYCTALTRKAALVLGKKDDAARYEKQFANIRAAFSKRFFDKTGKLTTQHETQTAYLMALDYNLLEPGLKQGVVKNLLRLVQDEAGGHLRTGFLGTPLIAFVLDREGHIDVAYEVLFKQTYPSWFFSIHQGATTMWERWNSYSHKDGFGNAGMNSFNHYAYGAIGQWMYERVAGLAPDPANPGYKHFFVQPNPGEPLTRARAELETRYGPASSGWEKTGDGLVVKATVPPNTTATFIVPELGSTKPAVTTEGKPCKLVERDGRLTVALAPGDYTFAVTAVR